MVTSQGAAVASGVGGIALCEFFAKNRVFPPKTPFPASRRRLGPIFAVQTSGDPVGSHFAVSVAAFLQNQNNNADTELNIEKT